MGGQGQEQDLLRRGLLSPALTRAKQRRGPQLLEDLILDVKVCGGVWQAPSCGLSCLPKILRHVCKQMQLCGLAQILVR
jgi:hypothetical protein